MGVSSLVEDGLGQLGVGKETSAALAPLIGNLALGAGIGALTGNPGAGAVMGGINGLLNDRQLQEWFNGAPDETASVTGRHGSLTEEGNRLFTPSGGALANAVSGDGGRPSPYSQFLAGILAAAQMAGSKRNLPQAPASMTEPLRTTGYLSRSANPNSAPASGNWSTWGQSSGQPQFFSANQVGFARGGALNMAAGGSDHLVRGPTGGQDDRRPAQLSDGEYVFTAADVSRAGGGNTEAGARRLDEMRAMLAKDAGAPLQQPHVKHPAAYLQRAARAGGR